MSFALSSMTTNRTMSGLTSATPMPNAAPCPASTFHDLFDHALVFVSNVNTGTVTRLNLAISPTAVTVLSATVIASGYTVMPNPTALILGPTGVAYDVGTDVLYVASTADNMIFAVSHAGSRTGSSGTGKVVFRDEHLRGPLALVLAPNGDLLTANGDAVNADPAQSSEIVEFTKQGKFVAQFSVRSHGPLSCLV